MTNNKLIKNAIFSLVTILAIFCVSNVKAATRADGNNGIMSAGSLADSNDPIKSTSSSGTISSGNTTIGGTSCSLFNVSVDHNASLNGGTKSASGKFVGPYIANQGNMVYSVTGAGDGCNGNYVAFCLDPNFDGVKTGTTIQYKAEQINPNSTFGLRMFALYTLYKQDGGATGDAGYFTYEVAARLLAMEAGSDYQSRSNTAKARLNSHLGVYSGGVNSVVPGSVGAAASALAQRALALANDPNFATTAKNSTLGVRLNQLGGAVQNGDSYGMYVNVTIENCQTATCANFGNLSFNMSVTQQGEGVYDEAAKTLTYTVLVNGMSADSCDSKTLEVTLNYSGAADIRNAMQISPVSKVNDDRQNYVVFSDASGQVKNSLNIGGCPDDGGQGCPQDAVLACDNEDENFAVVNEGASGGGATDWEGCIIGKTDSRGNSYDVVNTTTLYQTKEKGGREDAIQGYTSDTSGGGSLNGDPHAIEDSDFCIVSCKEKYAFILPGNKDEVKQGTYFSFQVDGVSTTHAVVGVSAERLCVSSGIKNNSFDKRVLDLRKQQIDFYNMYLYYKQLYNAMYSKQSMQTYKDKKTNSTCKYNHSNGTCDNSVHNDDCDTILNKDKFRDQWWVPSWDGSEITVEIKWYSLAAPDNLNNSELVEHKENVTLNKSFEQALGSKALQIPKKDFSFYSQYYKDYTSAWNTVMNVAEYSQTYSGSETKYIHTYGTEYEKVTRYHADNSTSTDYVCSNYRDDDHNATVTYLEDSRSHKSEWEDRNYTDPDGFVYKKYKAAMDSLKSAYELAKKKYEALNAQIGIQADAMQECTNYLEGFGEDNNPYKFNPNITFSYPDQQQYMAMLAPNRLENMHDGEVKVNYEKFFCASDPGSAESVFGCHDEASTLTKFGFGNLYSDTGNKPIDTVNQAKENIPKYSEDVAEYYNVGRVGSRATYGRYTADGSEGCSSSYIPGSGSKGDYCYEFYQSAKQFYTQAPDGLVTTESSGNNKTILDTDGRVYPVAINTPEGTYPFYVTFSNIGQFAESGSLGRLMGGGDGKAGVLQGELGDQEVCYYEVCRIDDPTCQKEENATCANIIANDCNNGNITDPLKFSDDAYLACVTKLINADCCSDVETYKDIRNGKWNKIIPSAIWEQYNKECNQSNTCNSFTIVSSEYYNTATQLSDIASVNNNGALQVNARAVSLNNLFPNDQKGINWSTNDAQTVITEIETVGDGIFGGDPDYSLTVDSKCAAAIRSYNKQEEGDGSGYSNGGYNDYSGTVKDATTKENDNVDTKGRTVVMSDEFRALLDNNCNFSGKIEPDTIVDSSKVES